MKYRNSSIYVQRQIDIILRKYRHFVRIYVDDIVIFFNTLKEHLEHLTLIFALFKKYNIVIKTFKTYFEYFIIVLLNQRVNNFDLFIVENKLKVILDLKFFHIFKHLKIYFDKIEYLRQYVVYYAQKTAVLQRRKTRLLRDALSKKRTRKMHSTRILINSSISKKNSFNQLQEFFTRISFLVYFNKNRILFIDFDVNKKRDWNVMMYHVKIDKFHVNVDANFFISFKRQNIEFIMFLNKILSSTKKRYWFIELKIIVLIWSIRKLRMMIFNVENFIVVYINHVVNSIIVNQTKFIFNSINKLNMKFVRVSMYLFQFRFKIYHRFDKFNLIFDALNRLFNIVDKNNIVDNLNIEFFYSDIIDFELNHFYVFNQSLIAMNDVFN